MKLKENRYNFEMYSFAVSLTEILFSIGHVRWFCSNSYHGESFLYCTTRFGCSIGASADLPVPAGASHPPDVPAEGEPVAGPVVPRGIRPRLPAVPHLSASHLLLRFGHHLHVVSLDQSVLVWQR